MHTAPGGLVLLSAGMLAPVGELPQRRMRCMHARCSNCVTLPHHGQVTCLDVLAGIDRVYSVESGLNL